MKTLTKLLRHYFGAYCILALALSACTPEAEIEVQDTEVASKFDSELTAILDLMDSNSALALEKLDDVIANAEALNSKYYSGKSKWYKAYIYDKIEEDVSEAYYYYNQALNDVLETDDSSLKMKIYNNLGILNDFYGQYDGAINAYGSALQFEDELSKEQISDLHYNLGVALKLKGDEASFSEAEKAFTRSLEYAKEVDYHGNIASIHNQIGMMYKTIKNYDIARITYKNTIETYASNPDMREHIGKAYHNIGVTYMEEGNAEASVRAFRKALEYKESSGSIFITKYDLGTILLKDGKEGEAIAMWKDALNEKHNKNSKEQVQIYSDLTTALQSSNQYEEALSYSVVYNSSIQNILQEDEKHKIESDRVLFASVVNEYDAFNKQVPFFSRPLVILFALLALLLVVSSLVYIYYRSRSTRKVSEVVSKIQSEFLDIKVD